MNIQAYTGRAKGQPPEKNQGERVVHDLVEVVKGTGRNISYQRLHYMDSSKSNLESQTPQPIFESIGICSCPGTPEDAISVIQSDERTTEDYSGFVD